MEHGQREGDGHVVADAAGRVGVVVAAVLGAEARLDPAG